MQPKQYRHFSSSARSIASHAKAIPEPVMSSNARTGSWVQLIPLPLASNLQFSANVNETGRFYAHVSNCPTVRTWNALKQQFIEQIAMWREKMVKEWRAAETHLHNVSYLKTRLDYYFSKVLQNGLRWWERASNYYLDERKSSVSWQPNAQWWWPKWEKVHIQNFLLKVCLLIFKTIQSVILTLMVNAKRVHVDW